ncbi:DUF2249 domain-containing protein [Cryobacterium sp. PH29-G1]|uniref:DUF2249 domain-containing protein n=1 Tax=Cryobacterium sp. PH29-G1 TaxID=3046211 RepID=UPI0024BAB7C7|nr:DUF2249 domain-containing protein [Cryobacterium sp. PH29-G1]MDJ0348345.1 DUF2249 domain-containing protein [Cryobacterium sp. PH29-G1]
MTAEPITISPSRPGAVDAGTPVEAPTGEPSNPHACACGHEDTENIVLDSRPIPHAIRHATIFGALSAIQPGFALDLIASHNPLPLLAQLESSRPGDFVISYRENGPETWTIRLTRAN